MWTTLQADVVTRLPRNGHNGVAKGGVATLPLHSNEDEHWEKRLNDLQVLRTYTENWDGQGADCPKEELLESAVHLADVLRQAKIDAPSCVVPGVNGTVVFEWQAADGAYFEIEVTEPYHADAYLIAPGGATEHWTFK